MRTVLCWYLLFCAALIGGVTASSAQSLLQGGDDPLDLTADEGLVWFRDENKVVATGNARAIRSGVELRADTLVAHYRERLDGGGNQFH
ncbi:MAG: hypothetical protein VX340_13745, partial [Pseudomonadota bacterium]|nr:hypothetical protein [Pseudomonadota bacterium]